MNNYKLQKQREIKRKYEAIVARGCKCEICGYSKNISAFEFHHLNANEKEYQLDSRHFSNTSIEKLEQELSKCILLCANCHREVHYPDLNMDNIPNLINPQTVSFDNLTGQVCPVCGKRFPKSTGKIYCSKECRDSSKNYPSKDEITRKYQELKSWEKVAHFYNLTRKILQRIRNKS